MRVLDLFSGIGGFSLGLERAGMTTVAFCEIDLIGMIALALIQRLDEPRPCTAFKVNKIRTIEVHP